MDALMWQPIKTAPKDGTYVLIYIPRSGEIMMACYLPRVEPIKDVTRWWTAERDLPLELAPSHWMPLPDPPEDSPQHP
jgi:hypothetical protein